MIGGLLKSTSSLAIIAAAGMFIGGLALTPAMAADLGGDCCADLEERVADLEATTARKGNRKVSLKISGWVARDIGWIEDEDGDSEFYSAGHGPSGSRVNFTGKAKLTANTTIGYVLQLRLDGDRDSSTLNQAGAGTSGGRAPGSPTIDKDYVYLKHAALGTVAFGRLYGPTNGVATISLGGRGITGDADAADWNATSLNGFMLEQDTSHEAIAYISPSIAGFTVAAAWFDLDDDAVGDSGIDGWEVALRYANEFGPIRIAAGIGYTATDDGPEGENIMGSVALMHTPTGLNVAFSTGQEQDGGYNNNGGADAFDKQFWYVQGGINQNFFGMGNTSLYGEYGDYDYDGGSDNVVMWGLGLVQHFDSAATELFLAYRNWEEDTSGDTVNQVMAGARIKF